MRAAARFVRCPASQAPTAGIASSSATRGFHPSSASARAVL